MDPASMPLEVRRMVYDHMATPDIGELTKNQSSSDLINLQRSCRFFFEDVSYYLSERGFMCVIDLTIPKPAHIGLEAGIKKAIELENYFHFSILARHGATPTPLYASVQGLDAAEPWALARFTSCAVRAELAAEREISLTVSSSIITDDWTGPQARGRYTAIGFSPTAATELKNKYTSVEVTAALFHGLWIHAATIKRLLQGRPVNDISLHKTVCTFLSGCRASNRDEPLYVAGLIILMGRGFTWWEQAVTQRRLV